MVINFVDHKVEETAKQLYAELKPRENDQIKFSLTDDPIDPSVVMKEVNGTHVVYLQAYVRELMAKNGTRIVPEHDELITRLFLRYARFVSVKRVFVAF